MEKFENLFIEENNFRESILSICFELRKEWARKDDEQIIIRDLSGGITNRLVACYLKENGWDTPNTLLFRLYGKNTEKFISRQNEIDTMKLMKSIGLGPEFYCKYKNGICYEYLPGVIIDQKMIYDEKIYKKLAEAIAKLNFANFSHLNQQKQPFVFPKMYELLNLVNEDYKANMSHMTDEFLKITPSLSQLKEEVKFLEENLTKYAKENDSFITFAHNDILLGNIIYNKNDDEIKFIDYEYGDYNYLAYDVANHFNEFSGVDEPDYSYFPNKEYQLKWLRIYLTSFYEKVNKYNEENKFEQRYVVNDAKLNQFYVEVNKFTLTSHMLWGIWALVQAQSSTLDFDFVKYANIRFGEYFKNKNTFIDL